MYKRQKSTENVSKWSKVLQMLTSPNKKAKNSQRDELKLLNRKSHFIPRTIQDGPQNPWQLYRLYRMTSEKLSQSSLSMYKSVQLKGMMRNLQRKRVESSKEQDEDDIPLGALIEKRQVNSCTVPLGYGSTRQQFLIQTA